MLQLKTFSIKECSVETAIYLIIHLLMLCSVETMAKIASLL